MLAGSDDRIADHLVDAAWLAWCDSLTGLCAELDLPHTGVPHGLPGELSRAWQGALRVRLPWFGATLSLVLSGDVVAAWVRQWRSRAMAVASSSPVPAQSSPLTPVVQAVSGRTVPLTVELAQVEIEIGALMTLRVGDVLRTTHALETPLLVRGEASAQDGGSPVFSEGFLGRLGERRAVELSKESSRD
jgi:hypothetical protein